MKIGLDLKSGILDEIWILESLESKMEFESEIWNPKWNWIRSLESKMELNPKSGILNGIGSEVWNPRWS